MTVRLRRATSDQLATTGTLAIRRLLSAAFDRADGGLTEEDWEHALGGVHVLLERDHEIVAHAAVVERELQVEHRPLRTGYVEAVAVDPIHQRRGFGSLVMAEVARVIVDGGYELGALATGHPGFYERLGWRPWTGPTYVRSDTGRVRTADEDGGILVLPTPATPGDLDLASPISCDFRPGDAW